MDLDSGEAAIASSIGNLALIFLVAGGGCMWMALGSLPPAHLIATRKRRFHHYLPAIGMAALGILIWTAGIVWSMHEKDIQRFWSSLF